jgi:hypothetical protein
MALPIRQSRPKSLASLRPVRDSYFPPFPSGSPAPPAYAGLRRPTQAYAGLRRPTPAYAALRRPTPPYSFVSLPCSERPNKPPSCKSRNRCGFNSPKSTAPWSSPRSLHRPCAAERRSRRRPCRRIPEHPARKPRAVRSSPSLRSKSHLIAVAVQAMHGVVKSPEEETSKLKLGFPRTPESRRITA